MFIVLKQSAVTLFVRSLINVIAATLVTIPSKLLEIIILISLILLAFVVGLQRTIIEILIGKKEGEIKTNKLWDLFAQPHLHFKKR